MRHRSFLAALLCGAILLSGCGSIHSPTGPSAPGAAERQPLSELEQIAQQVEAWEAAGSYDDEAAYRSALLRTVELARAADRGAYRCNDPQELGEEKLEELTSAAIACNYAYALSGGNGAFGEDLPTTIALLVIYMDDSPQTDPIYNLSGRESNVLPLRNYYVVPESALQPFLDRTLAPAAEAYRERGDEMADWGWLVMEDGSVYVDVSGLTSALPFGSPSFTCIEPLGGDRYLVRCRMVGAGNVNYPLAMVVEDIAPEDEAPQLVVLDCISADIWDPVTFLPEDEVAVLRAQYQVPGEGGQEAVDLLARLEALSPVPYHTQLAADMSPALEQALTDVKYVGQMIGIPFDDYVAALDVRATRYRYRTSDPWAPLGPEVGHSYGGAWNVFPGAELEEAFQRRLGIDLTANDRAWMDDRTLVPYESSSGVPIVYRDGEDYVVFMNARGGPMPFAYETSLTYHYNGTYTAVFTFVPDEWYDVSGTLTLRLRNVGTEEQPYFQLLGYELPS